MLFNIKTANIICNLNNAPIYCQHAMPHTCIAVVYDNLSFDDACMHLVKSM